MSDPYDLQMNTWYNWKFRYDNETCTVRFYINDELIFNVSNRYFYYSNEQSQRDGAMMIMWFINTQLKMDNVRVYNFYDYEVANQGNCSFTGTVDVRDEDYPTDDPVFMNIYKNGEDMPYKSAVLSGEGGDFAFKNIPEGEYFVEVYKTGFISEFFMIEVTEEAPDRIEIVELYQMGDFNTDGSIHAKDAFLLKQVLVGAKEGNNYYDLNRDAYVNAKDLLLLKHMIIGH